ncbi:MAG: hypothetical protein F6K50_04675 [Moorea sp. SIO3I7]|uniref:hypothetical protein n=1 Tax=Moorena sp. SIO3I8 TaxID=2607833 RepID=UPI0013C00B60|nr:hypothetical protein [Moorena sp. SIO3I8]NEN94843.1 hypothetical protein [Moorena sp. SIO3I7]NEO05339.1 hypothetical protein [Moorena sp. SIO3I8]
MLACLFPVPLANAIALAMATPVTPQTQTPHLSLFPDSRFPIPDSRFPIPDSRFPIPDSRFPIPDSPI